MSKKNHPLTLTSGALLIAAVFGPLGAARADDAPVASEPALQDGGAVPSITVTARRRQEKAQDVPAPITVVSGAQLEAQGLYQVQDLQQALPNVTSQFLHARQSSVAVRGIGNNTANEGLEGSVGIYLDNVFLGRPGQAVFDLLDLEQVDLLRGPQGTLFGKNTTAGVLNISTRLPTFEKEGHLEVALGQRGYRQVKGGYSGPISDTVAVRIAAYDTHDDGWLKNLQDDRRFNEINRKGVRAQALIKPNQDFSLRLIAEHNEEDSSTGTLVPYAYGPLNRGAAGGSLPGNATNYGLWLQAKGATKVIFNPYDYNVSIDEQQQAKVRQNAVSAEANWKLGSGADSYALTSITAWRDWRFEPKNDLDSSDLKALTGGFSTSEHQFSQELRLASPTGKSYDYVLGAYLYHQKTASYNHYDTGPLASAVSGGGYPNNNLMSGNGEAQTDSYAVFGQETWHVAPRLDLSAGLRLNSERKQGRVVQNALGNPSPYTAYPIFAFWDSGTLSRTDRNVASLLNASYRVERDVLTYATFSQGEKSGGYNVNGVASVGSAFGVQSIIIEPEKARNLDLGIKTAWLDSRLTVNANVFITKVKDYQGVTNVPYAPLASYIGVLTNIGDLTSKGFEFDARARLSRQLELAVNGAYTSATFDNGTGPTPFETFNDLGNPLNPLQGYGKGSRGIAGNRVNGAPKWILNTSVQWRQKLGARVEQYANANLALRSDSFGDINNSRYSRLPGYGLANASVGWRVGQGEARWDFSLWARNLFDKRYFLGLTGVGTNAYAASAGQPRTLGASARYDF